MSNKLYAERDIEGLDEDGNFYFKHVMAMTSEGLHSKSAIAAELGYRDSKIVELQSRLERANEERDALAATIGIINHMFAELRDYHVCNFHTENPFIGRLAFHKNWRLISDAAATSSHALHSLIYDSWLDGFHASSEGFNGEYREDEQLPNVLAKCFADGVCQNSTEAYQQHLRDVRAEAVLSSVEFFKPSRDIDVEALASYAERVMAGE